MLSRRQSRGLTLRLRDMGSLFFFCIFFYLQNIQSFLFAIEHSDSPQNNAVFCVLFFFPNVFSSSASNIFAIIQKHSDLYSYNPPQQ